MSGFLKRLAGFVCLQGLLAGLVIWLGSPRDSNHYLSALQDKINRLEQCSGKRLLIVGGSNAAFGIDSQNIQQRTRLETVNLGLHVSLGLPFYLEAVRQHCRAGDVVVLTPEYELLISDLQQGDAVTVNQLLSQWPPAARYIDQDCDRSWKRFLDRDALWQAHEWVGRACSRITKRKKAGRIYARSSFNDHGDVVAHHDRPTPAAIDISPLAEPDSQRLVKAIKLLNQFYRDCRNRGVAVCLSYPPMPREKFAASQPTIDHIVNALKSGLEMPLLHPPNEFVFPLEEFYDSCYHLTRSAGRQRSQGIANALEREGMFPLASSTFVTRSVNYWCVDR